MADSLILMVLALVVFGPRRLPQIGRQLGKLMYEFRKASNDFKFQMEEELRLAEEADRRKKEEAERQRTLALAPPAQESVSAELPAAVSAPESPYPGEEVYPPVTPAPAEPSQEESYPRIQPPSTGEVVPAERPSRPVENESEADDAATPGSIEEASGEEVPNPDATAEQTAAEQPAAEQSVTEQAPAEQTAPATEAVSHNG